MIVKCAYYFKLTLIVLITTLLVASVDTAPEHPVLFTAMATAEIIGIRLLWKSVVKYEVHRKDEVPSIRQRVAPKKKTNNRAA